MIDGDAVVFDDVVAPSTAMAIGGNLTSRRDLFARIRPNVVLPHVARLRLEVDDRAEGRGAGVVLTEHVVDKPDIRGIVRMIREAG